MNTSGRTNAAPVSRVRMDRRRDRRRDPPAPRLFHAALQSARRRSPARRRDIRPLGARARRRRRSGPDDAHADARSIRGFSLVYTARSARSSRRRGSCRRSSARPHVVSSCSRRGDSSRRRAASLIAGLLAALYAPFIFYEGVILPATIIVFLNALFVAIVFAEERPGAPRLLASGVVARRRRGRQSPDPAPRALCAAPSSFRRASDRTRAGSEGAAPRQGAARFSRARSSSIIGVVAAIAPLTIRNAIRTGEFIPLSTGGGINFYHGNNPAANGILPGACIPGDLPRRHSRGAGDQHGDGRLQGIGANAVADGGLAFLAPMPVSTTFARIPVRGLRFSGKNSSSSGTDTSGRTWRISISTGAFRACSLFPLPIFGLVAPLGLLGLFLTRRPLETALASLRRCLDLPLHRAHLLRARPVPAGRRRVSPAVRRRGGGGALLARPRPPRRGARALARRPRNPRVLREYAGGEGHAWRHLELLRASRQTSSSRGGDAASAEEAYRKALELNGNNEAAKRGLESIGARIDDGRR